MSLLLLLCALLIPSTCYARPNWHKGVVVAKDFNLHHLGHQDYSDAQLAAAQAIRDAGEDAQLHLAMLKKKYMDIVRQHFYNAFAPLPFVKERLDHFGPNYHGDVPVKHVPVHPLYIHQSPAGPCSGNILNCLHLFPSRLAKIVPVPSVGQPCYGANCNQAFNPHYKPMVIAKPSHTSHSKNKYPPKQHHHHIICDRKRPDKNCHHRSTFWPTYATVKLISKLSPHDSTPLEDLVNTHPTQPGKFSNKPDKKEGFGSQKEKVSKLENEILEIPDNLIPNIGTEPSIKSNTQISYVAKTEISTEVPTQPPLKTVEFKPEAREGTSTENIPTQKTHPSLVNSTPKFYHHESSPEGNQNHHEATESPKIVDKSIEDGQKITTSTTLSDITTSASSELVLKIVDEVDPSVKEKIPVESLVPTNEIMLESTSSSSLLEHESRATELNRFGNEIEENKTQGTTKSGDSIELDSLTFDNTPAWKSEITEMTTVEPRELPVPTTDQQTSVSEEYFPESKTAINYLLTTEQDANREFFTTTMSNSEQITRMENNDVSETTPVALVQPREKVTFESNQEEKEFTTQTIFRTVQDSTTYNSDNLGREDTDNGVSTTDYRKNDEEITTQDSMFSTDNLAETRDLFGESTTEENAFEPVETFYTTTYRSITLEENQEAREELFTDSYPTFEPISTEASKQASEDIILYSTNLPDKDEVGPTTELVSEPAETILGRQEDLEFTTTELPNTKTENHQEGKEDIFTESYETDDNTTEGKESKSSLDEDNVLFTSTMESTEDLTEKSEMTKYLLQAREDDIDHTFYNLEQTTSNHAPSEDFSSLTEASTQVFNGIVESKTETMRDLTTPQGSFSQLPALTESEQVFLTTNNDGELFVQSKENNTPLISTTNVFSKGTGHEDISTVTTPSELPQLREGDENIVLQETTESVVTTSEISTSRVTTVSVEEKLATETKTLTSTSRPEEKSNEPIPTIPKELFGKTDTPGLLFSEDWTEEQTEETSMPDLNTLLERETTEYPQSKFNEDYNFTETIPFPASTEASNTDAPQSKEETTQDVGELSTSYQNYLTEDYRREGYENVEESTQEYLPSENPSFSSYQSGVLKFTTEIETSNEEGLQTEFVEATTIPESILEVEDSVNRRRRSVTNTDENVREYPTTECVLCLLGLPHGHRWKRTAVENKKTDNKPNKLHEKSNCSFSISLNLEDTVNPIDYASTILELLPVIREGYRNNAFSEEDKQVIRSLFGDMKALVDEETFDKITETGELLMGDGASRLDEDIEDFNYDSSEPLTDEVSEKERLKRSKKNLQIMNELLKRVPNNMGSHSNVPMKKSRSARSTQMSQADASAILALLSETGELQIQDDEDEYEYYDEEEEDEYGDEEFYVDPFEDDYDDTPSFFDLIKLAKRHKERKARAEKS
ncbi:uncharacterized protein LOC128990571 [Macrosteles quadrilineatus]|uniref:uncharacterized protein LOC128990571 n=1 Tax=Macrosteles quadrilineatus TaxID=74068 RepID=UPI0023E23C99|nr:uncharacterized protein LOC128990571 [Macrosteles quadrilineatus]